MRGLAVADRQHRLAHALLLVDLLVHALHAEVPRVERDRRVEVGHGDTDVVDRGEQVAGDVGVIDMRDHGACAAAAGTSLEVAAHAGAGPVQPLTVA